MTDRKRLASALVIVTSLGVVLSILGMTIESGIDPVGPLYSAFTLAFVIVSLLYLVSISFYFLSQREQNQSQAKTDSSLV
jgi:urea transporter